MNWQDYQKAVSEFYAKAEGVGVVRNSKSIPDKDTGQPRQVDCYLEVDVKGHHKVIILIDAKFRKNKINVNHVDSVSALARSVRADKAIIVCSNGWTEPAATKAASVGMDLRLWSAEHAAEFMNPDFWMFCPLCGDGLIIMDSSGFTQTSLGLISWWIAGQCRECKGGVIWCQDCGRKFAARYNKTESCDCGHMWGFDQEGLQLHARSI